jgi:hypothetical protein
MLRVSLCLGALILATASYAAPRKAEWLPAAGVVPNAKTALVIARAILTPIYGAETIQSEEPLRARLDGSVWVVTGTLNCSPNCKGGTATIGIAKSDGRVVTVFHGK